MKGNRSVGAVSLAMWAGLAAGQSVQYRPVVLTGQQAPGFPEGVVFGDFPNYRLFDGNPNLAQFRINNSGQVSFFAPVLTQGPDGPPTVALFGPGAGGTLTKVTMAGETVPGLAEGLVFSVFETSSLVMNNPGQLAFRSLAAETVDSTAGLRRGIFGPMDGAELAAVALDGLTPPGFTEEFRFSVPSGLFSSSTDPSETPVQLNDAGETAFRAFVLSNEDPTFFGGGLFGPLGESRLTGIALRGEQIPGFSPGVQFGGFDLDVFSLNNSGQVFFADDPNSGPSALLGLTDASGNFEFIVSGDPAPGFSDPEQVIGIFSSNSDNPLLVSLNDASDILFTANVLKPLIDGREDVLLPAFVLFGPQSDGSLGPIAQTGMQVPGLPNDIVYNGFLQNNTGRGSRRSVFIFNPQLSSSGQVAFTAVLAGRLGSDTVLPTTGFPPDDTALMGPLGDSRLTAIARANDPVPGFESELRYSSLAIDNPSPVFDAQIAINSRGQVAFFARIIDNFTSFPTPRSGLFMTDMSGRVHPVAIEAVPGPVFHEGLPVAGRLVQTISPRFDFNDQGELVFGVTFFPDPIVPPVPTPGPRGTPQPPDVDEGGVFVATVGLGGPGCNLADVSDTPPGSGNYGQLDGNDIGLFIRAFLGGGPLADLSDTPAGSGEFGQFDGGDIGLFVSQFLAGCGAS